MSIHIKILGVKDGDANIITLKNPKKSFVILIDSGEQSFNGKVISELEQTLQPLNKKGPDLIVCTHFDSDHLGGMVDIVTKFKENIGCVWLHKPTEAVQKKYALEALALISEKPNPKLLKQMGKVLKSIPQLRNLVKTIENFGIPIEEPFAGHSTLKDWPEIEVVGPTKQYFHLLFPQGIKDVKKLMYEEAEFNLLCEFKEHPQNAQSACEILDRDPDSKKLTATNKASIILNITIDQKKYLFTGDAGIESLEQIPDYQDVIKDLFFFKIPHHASRNNISSSLISIMKPIYASVSGEKYFDQEVASCLQNKGSQVKIACDEDVELSVNSQCIIFQ
jgi:beta-lactamase superfamily II metal-dependent hydrolase